MSSRELGPAGAPSSTSTTLGPPSFCADATQDGELTATDALAALRGAVGADACAPCLCDVNGDGQITASDALAILRAAVSNPNEPPDDCPQACTDPQDPCIGAASCDRQTVGDDDVVTGSTATGYHSVISGPSGTASIVWTVSG